MKKISKLIAAFSILTSVTFTGCFDPVFNQIMHDVPTVDATVSGIINSIARYSTTTSKEYLVLAANDGLKYKLADSTTNDWTTYNKENLPFTLHEYDYYGSSGTAGHIGQQILKVLADKDYVYLVTAEYYNNEDEGTSCPSKIYIYAGQFYETTPGTLELTNTGWKLISKSTDYCKLYQYSDYTYSAFNVFSTNSVQRDHRFVYIRSGDIYASNSNCTSTKYYQLNGDADPADITATAVSFDSPSNSKINSAVYFGSEVLFFNSSASETDETETSPATRFYFAGISGSSTATYYEQKIYYSDVNSKTVHECPVNFGNPVSAIAVFKDSLIIGKADFDATSSTSSGGVERVELDSTGTPADTIGKFTTNAQNQLLGSYFIYCLLSVDPSQKETDGTCYATLGFLGTGSSTTATFGSVGLWSYYKDRGNWNRE